MIDAAISKHLRDEVLLVSGRVSQNLSTDNVQDAQIIFSIDPITQTDTHGRTTLQYREVLTIDVYTKREDQLNAIDITEEVDTAIAKIAGKSLGDYRVTNCCPMHRWRFVQEARSEQIIYQRQYWFNHI